MVAGKIRNEMKRWGISRPRLIRRARADGVTGVRVDQVLAGSPGWLGQWTTFAIEEWREKVRTAWNY